MLVDVGCWQAQACWCLCACSPEEWCQVEDEAAGVHEHIHIGGGGGAGVVVLLAPVNIFVLMTAAKVFKYMNKSCFLSILLLPFSCCFFPQVLPL